jgi:membrane protein implicated in regulation of membrane protease activity
MQDYKDRKLTPAELAGVTAAILMFFGIGMIMGGTSAANDTIFYSGVGIFAIGSAIALYLLFKYKPKDHGDY